MDNVVLVEVVDRLKDLSNRLGRILFCKLALLANTVEQLSSSSQLSDDVVLVLRFVSLKLVETSCGLYPGLEPVVELDNVRVLHALQHLKLIVDHLLVALDISLQDDLHSDLSLWTVGLSNDTICSRAQCLAEAVAGPVGEA